MNKTLKKFAIAMLATGATVAANRPMAAATDTNTFTNAIQSISINLTVYTNAAKFNTDGTIQNGEKPITLTTKSIISALSNASATIPSLVGFDFGRSAQLVIDTTFTATNIQLYTTNAILTNAVILSATNDVISFQTNTLPVPAPNFVTIIDTNGSALITNNAISNGAPGTNVLTHTGDWTQTGTVGTNGFSYDSSTAANTTNGTWTNAAPGGPFPTNLNCWTVITANTNTAFGVTNVVAITYSNAPSGIQTNFATNGASSIKVQGGTATAPVFADVSSFVYGYIYPSVIITGTGTNLLKTNQFGGTNYLTQSVDGIKNVGLHVFGLTTTSPLQNLSLTLDGFAKAMMKLDVLHTFPRTETNQVFETSSTATISGSGNIGGTFLATNTPGAGTNSVSVYSTSEYYGTNTAATNNILTGSATAPGIIINPVPAVVTGTITVGPPHSVAE
jgi:hypothetical protein